MMAFLCFAIGIAVLGVAAFFAYKNRHQTTQCIASITLGIFFTTFFMILPTQWVKAGKEVSCEPLYALLCSLIYSLKTLGGGQDITQLETMPLPGIFKAVYIALNYTCFGLAPILASGLLLSFIGDTGERIRLLLNHSPKHYIFSEVSESALSLAGCIQKKSGKKTIVFCDTKNADKNLIAKAKRLGAIVLYKPCDTLKIRNRKRVYEFYLLSDVEDRNMRLAECLIAKHSGSKKAHIVINTFVESGTNVRFLEDVLHAKGSNSHIELHCIDEIALLCNHLIYNHPLYNTKGHDKRISVAIVGCGRTGMRMLKTAYWAGQIDGYTLKIRVYDKNADTHRENFYRQCPGLKDDPTIRFVKADVDTLSFQKQLLEQENSADATYIVIAMGDDQLNLSVADELYRIYRRHRAFDDQRMPEIFTRIRSQAKFDIYSEHKEYLDSRHIHLFGTAASVFSDKTLFNTELENLAFAVHLTYHKALSEQPGSQKYEQVRKDFKTSEYARRSSMAAALHLPAKVYLCDDVPQNGKNSLTEENLQTYAAWIKKDPTFYERLAKNEHTRWNAFMLSEGYQPASVEEMHLYAPAADSHRDDLSLLHPCIIPWNALNEVESIYNRTYHKDKAFKYYDRAIVKNTPTIWAVSQAQKGDD